MRALVLALLLMIALPGCALFDAPAATSTTTTSTPSSSTSATTPATPGASHGQQPTLRDLVVVPTEISLGDGAGVKVTVVNPTSANLTARVDLLLDSAPAVTVTGTVAPNGALELGGRLQPSSQGTHTVGARLANSTLAPLSATLRVLGPRLANATVTPAANQGCNRVTYTVTFTNVGDGPARDVRVTAQLLGANNATVDAQTKPIGLVNAGQNGAVAFSVDAMAKCPDPVTYRVAVTVDLAPGSGDALHYVSPPFQV